MPLSIGIDIGGTNLRAARISETGEILKRVSEKSAPDPELVLGRIADMVRLLDTPDVKAVGVGVPGRVDALRGAVLSGGYVNLASVALAQRLEDMTGKPVVIDNDCNMALAADLALLGGGLGRAAHAALGRAPALAPWYQCQVEPAQLGDDAGVIGAGLQALAGELHTSPSTQSSRPRRAVLVNGIPASGKSTVS